MVNHPEQPQLQKKNSIHTTKVVVGVISIYYAFSIEIEPKKVNHYHYHYHDDP